MEARYEGFGRLSGRLSLLLLIATSIIPVAPAIVLVLDPGIVRSIEGLAYVGVFAVNFLLTAHALPVPGVSALGQAVIVREAAVSRWPWLVGLAGGLGMGVAEIVPYVVGSLGNRTEHAYARKIPRRVKRWGERVARPIAWLMDHAAELTLFVLAAVPNPFYEVAGLSAGSTRLRFWRFLTATVAGKLVRGMILAYAGTKLPIHGA